MFKEFLVMKYNYVINIRLEPSLNSCSVHFSSDFLIIKQKLLRVTDFILFYSILFYRVSRTFGFILISMLNRRLIASDTTGFQGPLHLILCFISHHTLPISPE